MQCDLLNEADVSALARAIGGKPDAMLYLAANGDPAASSERVALGSRVEHAGAS